MSDLAHSAGFAPRDSSPDSGPFQCRFAGKVYPVRGGLQTIAVELFFPIRMLSNVPVNEKGERCAPLFSADD
ncbi:MAG: hypothetical protein CMN76_17310 [Spirochaetaceae bacterium]|nr:hypothetical protein [Spirochaetaceae bacterium]